MTGAGSPRARVRSSPDSARSAPPNRTVQILGAEDRPPRAGSVKGGPLTVKLTGNLPGRAGTTVFSFGTTSTMRYLPSWISKMNSRQEGPGDLPLRSVFVAPAEKIGRLPSSPALRVPRSVWVCRRGPGSPTSRCRASAHSSPRNWIGHSRSGTEAVGSTALRAWGRPSSKKLLVPRRVERRLEQRHVSIDTDEPFDLVPECGEVRRHRRPRRRRQIYISWSGRDHTLGCR